ncbi:RHS repeat domain-containing protein [Serratia sp. FGI94]|uniref:RHS repeat domain-containing protein n=1 Tax=Serratia sp. FGI94 TaxID=671990 RepID=UPI001F2B894B|nr:RHS repeat domain-containing protein [Serratia sp. FGI94]
METRYQYDRFGRLTALVNPNNERWQFDYDAGHRLLAQSDFAAAPPAVPLQRAGTGQRRHRVPAGAGRRRGAAAPHPPEL